MVVIVEWCDDPRGLTGMFEEASKRVMPEFTVALKQTVSSAHTNIKRLTPVYNPAKYPKWVGYPNAHTVGGRLKRSIRKGGVMRTNNDTIKASIRALQPYASYVNDGFYHKKAKKTITGRKFMENGAGITINIQLDPILIKSIQRIFIP